MDNNSNFSNNHLFTAKPKRPSTSATLRDHEVPQFAREPYIASGYRASDNITLRQCLATLFTIHNETFNIWSHIIATVAFVVYSTSVFLKHDVIGEAAFYPLLCFSISICIAFFFSSFAHLFCCMSWRVRNICFYIDYATISMFTLTAGQGFIFYCRPLSDDSYFLYRFPYVFLGISFSLSCINMALSCLSRHRFRKYRFLMRTGLYVVKFIYDISPFIIRCLMNGPVCNANTVYLFKRHMLCYAISGIVNASRLPERLFPGYFDLLGHSHHIFHVLLVIGNFDAFNVMFTDMMERKDVLSASSYPPTFFTTFGLLILLAIFNSVVVVWFVRNWLTTEEEELFAGSKYLVIYKKTSELNDKKIR